MITVIYYDRETGKALSQLTGPDLGGFPEAGQDSNALLLTAPVSLPGYITGTTFTPLPAKPFDSASFNWASKQWEDPRTLQDLKDAKWETIKAARDFHETGTFQWNGHTIDADKERVNGAATGVLIAKGANIPYEDVWTLADNSTIPVTGDDILAMGVALVQHVSSCHARARVLRQMVNNATTKEQVEAITWEAEL